METKKVHLVLVPWLGIDDFADQVKLIVYRYGAEIGPALQAHDCVQARALGLGAEFYVEWRKCKDRSIKLRKANGDKRTRKKVGRYTEELAKAVADDGTAQGQFIRDLLGYTHRTLPPYTRDTR